MQRGYDVLAVIAVPPLALSGELTYDFPLPASMGPHLIQISWTTPDGPAPQVIELLQGQTAAFDPALPVPTHEGGAKVYKSGAFPDAAVGRPMLPFVRVKITADDTDTHNGCVLVVGMGPGN